jgi:mercuric ion transport protein
MMVFACKTIADRTEEKSAQIKANPEAVVQMDVSIKGMSCTACENTIKAGVAEMPGVVGVTASYQDGKATVKFDTTLTDITSISTVINSRGYTVTGHKKAEVVQ